MVVLIDNNLRQFNGDISTKEAVLAFIHDYIDKKALEMMYKKENVEHISDAVKLVDGAFEQLEINYGIQQKPKPPITYSK